MQNLSTQRTQGDTEALRVPLRGVLLFGACPSRCHPRLRLTASPLYSCGVPLIFPEATAHAGRTRLCLPRFRISAHFR